MNAITYACAYARGRHSPVDYASPAVRRAITFVTRLEGNYGYVCAMAMLHDAHGHWALARQYRLCADRIQQMRVTMRGLIEMEYRAAAAAE